MIVWVVSGEDGGGGQLTTESIQQLAPVLLQNIMEGAS